MGEGLDEVLAKYSERIGSSVSARRVGMTVRISPSSLHLLGLISKVVGKRRTPFASELLEAAINDAFTVIYKDLDPQEQEYVDRGIAEYEAQEEYEEAQTAMARGETGVADVSR